MNAGLRRTALRSVPTRISQWRQWLLGGAFATLSIFICAQTVFAAAPEPSTGSAAASALPIGTGSAASVQRTPEESLAHALEGGDNAFCTREYKKLTADERYFCPQALRLQHCESLQRACKDEPVEKAATPSTGWMKSLAAALMLIIPILMWLLLAVAICVVAYLIVRAYLNWRQDADSRTKAPQAQAAKVSLVPELEPPPALAPAQSLLDAADEQLRAGQYARALGLYLQASLRALDDRGELRLRRSKTRGEYLRQVQSSNTRKRLAFIVRAADAAEFGHLETGADAAARVASEARALVLAQPAAPAAFGAASLPPGSSTVMVAFCMLASCMLLGCSGTKSKLFADKATKPEGGELARHILIDQGIAVKTLTKSITSLPIPDGTEPAPAVLINAEELELDEASAVHLERWVEGGGTLVVAGVAENLPDALRVPAGSAMDPTCRLGSVADVPTAAATTGSVKGTAVAPAATPPYAEAADDAEGPARVEAAKRPRGAAAKQPEAAAVGILDFPGSIDLQGRLSKHKGKAAHAKPSDSKPQAGKADDKPQADKPGKADSEVRPQAPLVVWATRGTDAYVTMARVKQGRVVTLATDELLHNAAIAQPGNARAWVMLIRKLELGPSQPLYFANPNSGTSPPSSPFASLDRAGLTKALAHAAVACLLLFLAVGVRFARPIVQREGVRRAYAEHVEAVGLLYGKRSAVGHSVLTYARFVEERVRAKMPRGLASVGEGVAYRTGMDATEVDALLTEAQAVDANAQSKGLLPLLRRLVQVGADFHGSNPLAFAPASPRAAAVAASPAAPHSSTATPTVSPTVSPTADSAASTKTPT